LSPYYFSFISYVSSITIPKNVTEALDHPGWQEAMVIEMQALKHNQNMGVSSSSIWEEDNRLLLGLCH